MMNATQPDSVSSTASVTKGGVTGSGSVAGPSKAADALESEPLVAGKDSEASAAPYQQEDGGEDGDSEEGPNPQQQASALLYCALVAGVFTLAVYFVPELETPPLLENIGLSTIAQYGWAITFDPMFIGGGMLCGSRVGVSLLLGAVLAWGVLGPLVRHWGWTQGEVLDG